MTARSQDASSSWRRSPRLALSLETWSPRPRPRVARQHASSIALSALVAALAAPACRPTPARPPELAPATATATQPQRPTLAIDAARMLADIEHLASDRYRGRYSLSPELRESARWIADRYTAIGASSLVEGGYEAPFPITVGVRERAPTRLAIARGRRASEISPSETAPVALSGSGTVRAAAVFVGYAAKADEIAGVDGAPAIPGYDDLAGVDLRGKIAVLLLEAPGRPNLRDFFRRLQRQQITFEAAIGGLKERADVAGITALHADLRGELVALIEPFLPGAKLDDLWPLPADPLTLELDLSGLFTTLMREAAKLKGPRFDNQAGQLRGKLARLAEAGAVGAVVVRGPRSFVAADEREADAFEPIDRVRINKDDRAPFPVVQLKWKTADRSLRVRGQTISQLQAAIDRDLRPRSAPIDGQEIELRADLEAIDTPIPNVLATIRGGDLADQIVVLGAHYDHIGAEDEGQGGGDCNAATINGQRDTICNGADDNASGTAMVLEIARALIASGYKPRRTLIFTHFAGEELGLLGSKALIEDPPFELAKVTAMVNLDMVGRLGPKGLAIGGIHSSDDWMPLLDQLGANGMSVLYEGSVASRSDHANFYRQKIPVLFFFTGVHADYHRPGDHTDKINKVGLQTIGELVGELIFKLADGHPIAYTEPTAGRGLSGGLPGSDPDTLIKRVRATEQTSP
jgi:hypothetical protein